MTEKSKALSTTAFATLLLIAFMMGANHVSARFAFNHGVDVVTAVSFRSVVTAVVVGLILWQQKVQIQIQPHHKKYLPLIGLIIAVQSVCLYSSVARLPVALALLAFNTYPLSTAFWARVLYKHQPEKALLWSMPIILVGLALALDVMGAASGLGASAHWAQIGSGVAFALTASATFGLALVYTQHETAGLDGRVRTFSSMSLVGVLAVAVSAETMVMSVGSRSHSAALTLTPKESRCWPEVSTKPLLLSNLAPLTSVAFANAPVCSSRPMMMSPPLSGWLLLSGPVLLAVMEPLTLMLPFSANTCTAPP